MAAAKPQGGHAGVTCPRARERARPANTSADETSIERDISRRISNADHARTLEYIATPQAASAARTDTIETLKGWGLYDLTEVAELLVSELVTNAINATPARTVIVHLCVGHHALLIAVWDNNPRAPVLRRGADLEERGRGLWLVDVLSDRWDYYAPRAGGKIVWFELRLQPDPNDTQVEPSVAARGS